MMACDICGKNTMRLVDLLDSYQTTEIKQICPDCETVVNKKQWEVRSLTTNILFTLVKRFMGERRAAR